MPSYYPMKRSPKKNKIHDPTLPLAQEFSCTKVSHRDHLHSTTLGINVKDVFESAHLPPIIMDKHSEHNVRTSKKKNMTHTEQCYTLRRIHTILSSANGVLILVTTTYILNWVLFLLLAHGLGVNSSSHKSDSSSDVILVLLCEVLKLIVSVAVFISQNSIGDLLSFFKSSSFLRLSLQYLPVALCYAFYNILMFGNLKNVSPTIYLILGESRLLMTAVVWQLFFKTGLSRKKMSALVLITLGILVKDVNFDDQNQKINNDSYRKHSTSNYVPESTQWQIFLIVLQIMCGVMASVYNENCLKNLNYNQHLQNMLLYLNSIIVNIFIAAGSSVKGNLDILDEVGHLVSSKSSKLVIILLTSAGILSALMLKYVGSVSKGVASAAVMAIMPIAEFYWFGHKCRTSDILSVTIVTTGVVLYTVPNVSLLNSFQILHGFSITRRYTYCMGRIKEFSIRHMLFLIGGLMLIITGFPYVLLYAPSNLSRDVSAALFHPIQHHNYENLTERSGNSNLTCTRLNMHRARPERTRKLRYERIEKANEILAYITETINEQFSAPVAIVWGTMLHEYRNGSGPCIMLNFDDKDVDILVFPKQFQMILAMDEYIRATWGWRIHTEYKDLQFLYIRPMNDNRIKRSHNPFIFQIDIYSFICNHEESMLEFPYDIFKWPMNGFLPLVPYKTIMIDWNHNMTERSKQDDKLTKKIYMHTPFDPKCLLNNMYGRDFMIPKETREYNHSPYGDLPCKEIETLDQEKEMMRQLTFC